MSDYLSQKNRILFFLVLIGVKLGIVLAVIPHLGGDGTGLYRVSLFPDGYDLIAKNLIDGQGYRFFPETSLTMKRTPGYVFLLAGIFALFGKQLVAAQIVNILLGFVAAWAIIGCGQRFLKREETPYFAALFFLLHPSTIMAESRAGLESLLTTLLAVFTLALYRAIDGNRPLWYAISGAVLGLALLVKSTPFLIPPFLFFYLLLSKHRELGLKVIFRNVLLLVVPMILLLSPWIIRNYALTQKLVLTSSMIGSTSFQGQYVNNRLFSGKECRQLLRDATLELNAIAEGLSLKFKKGFFQYFYDPKDELYFEAHVLDIVKKDYIESPVSLVRALALNFFGFWFQGRASVSTLVNFVLTFPLLILAGIGIHRGQKNHLNTGPILLILLAFPLAHLPFLGLARYHVPLLPLLALVAFIPLDARNTSHACPARSP